MMWHGMVASLMVVTIVVRADDTDLTGDHVCYDQKLQHKVINTTYLVAVKIRKYKYCLNIPPKCAYYENKMETRWKTENVTRLVNVMSCCSGYQAREWTCHPHCSSPCINGECSAPETCSCQSGFSGAQCDVAGCPGGRWGQGCLEHCKCENGGHCHPSTGSCACSPGYEGLKCQNKCGVGRYGAECKGKCRCPVGHQCHFVTGECTPCPSGTYGENCANKCDHCDASGTALCGHNDGKCYCEANRFGKNCDLTCPFGFINNTCYTSPVNLKCLCPNDLYICDLEKGCVCPEGKDCGVEVIGQVEVASLSGFSVSGQDSVGHTSAVYAICALLIIGAVAAMLIVIYYRRRLKVMKKDITNRSVYYVENGVVGDNRHHDLIVSNREPLDQEDTPIATASQDYPAAANSNFDMPNNARISFRTKNVNIDNYKLGLESQKFPQNHCVGAGAGCQTALTSEAVEGSVEENVVDDPEDEINVNLFTELDTKNNAAMARLYGKEGKKDLEFIIRNNLGTVASTEDGMDDLCGGIMGAACSSGVVDLPLEKAGGKMI